MQQSSEAMRHQAELMATLISVSESILRRLDAPLLASAGGDEQLAAMRELAPMTLERQSGGDAYAGVIKHVSLEEEEEVKGQMHFTQDEYEEKIDTYGDPSRMDKLLEIQQAFCLANLKYMAWETGVNEEKLLEFWSNMVDLPQKNKYFVDKGSGSD